jgi:hypothetical protein
MVVSPDRVPNQERFRWLERQQQTIALDNNSLEMVIRMYQIKRCHIPQDSNRSSTRSEKFIMMRAVWSSPVTVHLYGNGVSSSTRGEVRLSKQVLHLLQCGFARVYTHSRCVHVRAPVLYGHHIRFVTLVQRPILMQDTHRISRNVQSDTSMVAGKSLARSVLAYGREVWAVCRQGEGCRNDIHGGSRRLHSFVL